jgi:uncharacterized protein (UPF0332 family)
VLPESFLDVADELAQAGGPSRLRSAVSRAYYAVFHVASEASAKLGAARSNSHDVIGDRFQTSDDPEISELGQRFLNLKTARQHADYRISRPGSVEEPSSVMVHLREARELVDVFGELPTGALREAARRAILAYEGRSRGR